MQRVGEHGVSGRPSPDGRPVRAVAVGLALLAVGGCASARQDDRGEPHLVLLDSTVLAEPDSALLGRFAYFAADDAGTLFIADLTGGRVLRYSRGGTLELIIGGAGSGPGELLAAGQPGLIDDTVLAVPDPRSRALSLFDTRDGTFLARHRIPFPDVGQSWTRRGDTVVFGAQFAPALLGRVVVPTGDADGLGTAPESARLLGPFFFRYGRIEAVPISGGWLAQLPAEPGLRVVGADGALGARLRIPVRHRRGVPADLIERHQAARDSRGFRHLGSMAAGLWRITGERTAMLTLDVDPAPTGEPANPRYYLSVINPGLDSACVDGPVPFGSDSPLPMPHAVGDTLLTLERRIDHDVLRTLVFRYLIDTQGCNWAPVVPEAS